MITPNKAFGQHYLVDKGVIDDICCGVVRAVQGFSCRVIEVGPGTGNLTRPLAQCLPHQLLCIECDDRFVPVPGVAWVHGDALTYQYTPNDLVVGNLPYNIATELLLRLAAIPVAGWWVMVQKEVAQRIVATAGSAYGRLSVVLQSIFSIDYCFEVPHSCFVPPPRVESACIRGKRSDVPSPNLVVLDLVLRAAFACKRKKLSNVLPPDLARAFQACGVDLAQRAETVSTAQYVAIAAFLAGCPSQ